VDKTYKQHKDIKVIENQIDLTLYNKTFPSKDRDQITLMHFGSTSHFEDLLDKEFVNGMDKILKEFPNVMFKTVGAFIPYLRYKWGSRYQNAFGHVDIYKWIKDKFPIFMEECDIMVVPLLDTKYNRCKSDIKFLESGSAMKPGIFSAVRPYTDTIIHKETGYLVNTENEWYESMKLLITDEKERRRIGKNAYKYIKKERQIQDHVKEYADFIKQKFDII
jgi:glycosyltransferase involved in cell wall biosynthesis